MTDPLIELRDALIRGWADALARDRRVPLTRELILERVGRLATKLVDEGGAVGEEMTRQIRCDGCGFVYDLLREGAYPVGWTTVGSFEDGFDDRCRACSA